MNLIELSNLLDKMNMPVAYNVFPDGEIPNCPFLAFLRTGVENISADNAPTAKKITVQIELYVEKIDFKVEEKLESLLESADLNYKRQGEQWLDDEKVFMIVYSTAFIERRN